MGILGIPWFIRVRIGKKHVWWPTSTMISYWYSTEEQRAVHTVWQLQLQ
jgi:hypothetical protein